MVVIVTGGAGFIGSNFIFYMLKKYSSYKIICLDKLTYAGNLTTLKPIMDSPNFKFIKADICDGEAVDKIFDEFRPDVVINFAAESHVDRSIKNPEVFFKTNVIGTIRLMDACKKYKVKLTSSGSFSDEEGTKVENIGFENAVITGLTADRDVTLVTISDVTNSYSAFVKLAENQVPIDVKPDRGTALASQWIIEAARKRGGKSMIEKLTSEILDASNSMGSAVKKKEDTHKMAEANKAFVHYRY